MGLNCLFPSLAHDARILLFGTLGRHDRERLLELQARAGLVAKPLELCRQRGAVGPAASQRDQRIEIVAVLEHLLDDLAGRRRFGRFGRSRH